MKKIILITLLAIQSSFSQNPLNVGSLQISNDNVYNTTVSSGGVARMYMGYDGAKGYIQFGAHTGGGQRDNILYMRGNDGYVGLGTQNPSAILDIYLPIITPATYDTQKWSTSNTEYNLKLQTTWNQSGINQEFIQRFNGVDYKSLAFFGGSIGIGTSTPDEKLTVKGKIHTQEVRVDMSGPLVPDYVFERDYKLKSLKEIETYIKENKHLPEIPSAQEIEAKGLMLAEMNMNLLKKIEELTLYMIEQEKKNDLQSKEIDSLKKENKNYQSILERVIKLENQSK